MANDYTLQFEVKRYQIDRKDIRAGLRGGQVRVEKRRDGTVMVRFQDRYVTISECPQRAKPAQPKARPPKPVTAKTGAPSPWKNFDLKKGPKVWQAAQASGGRPGEVS